MHGVHTIIILYTPTNRHRDTAEVIINITTLRRRRSLWWSDESHSLLPGSPGDYRRWVYAAAAAAAVGDPPN